MDERGGGDTQRSTVMYDVYSARVNAGAMFYEVHNGAERTKHGACECSRKREWTCVVAPNRTARNFV